MDRPLTVRTYLDFEKPIAELESKVAELSALSVEDDGSVSITEEVTKLQQKAHQALVDTYAKLTPWQKTQVARHPDRPHCLDYVEALIEDFTPLAGDRYYAEDAAIMGGIGRFRGRSVMLIGHEKGSDTESRIKHNFGMARPEGYRKAVRLMDLAERFGMPVITLVDTAGAYPGIGAEERGQAEAIARSTDRCLSLGVPLVAVIIGEGGSGGAVAIATANRVLMLEHAIYTVASPEAAASILWRDPARAIDAATSMKITAQDLKQLGVIDVIITEPVGGAHRDTAMIFKQTAGAIAGALTEFSGMSADGIREQRQEKFLAIGRNL
jgi:acetyl-CoA carboxylase carboxyl transferase subunit alpha